MATAVLTALLPVQARKTPATSNAHFADVNGQANAATFGPGVKALPLGEAYSDVGWIHLFRKVGDLTKRPFDWSSGVAKLQARTLPVFADADAIRPEHMVEFWKALGGGRRDRWLI